ncbi:MAG: ATP-binding protein [Acidobacteriota bacterium]
MTTLALRQRRFVREFTATMATRCLICGREISTGLTCEKCDRKPSRSQKTQATGPVEAIPLAGVLADLPAHATSLPLRSLSELLGATGEAIVLLSPERAIRLVTPMARRLLGAEKLRSLTLSQVESRLGQELPSLDQNISGRITVGETDLTFSLVPLESGHHGAALILQPVRPREVSRAAAKSASAGLRALCDALNAAQKRNPDPILGDAAGTLEGILATLETIDAVSERPPPPSDSTITEIVEELASRFTPIAELKALRLQSDMKDAEGRTTDGEDVFDALSILVENSLHYVRKRGTVVVGARVKEQRGHRTAVFFVMDSGPVISETNALAMFSSDFEWDSSNPERTGKDLFRAQQIAGRLGGKCWVECKAGKTCTFFVSIRLTE